MRVHTQAETKLPVHIGASAAVVVPKVKMFAPRRKPQPVIKKICPNCFLQFCRVDKHLPICRANEESSNYDPDYAGNFLLHYTNSQNNQLEGKHSQNNQLDNKHIQLDLIFKQPPSESSVENDVYLLPEEVLSEETLEFETLESNDGSVPSLDDDVDQDR